jgi:hypothetical protein
MFEHLLYILPQLVGSIIVLCVLGYYINVSIPKALEKENNKQLADGKPAMTIASYLK